MGLISRFRVSYSISSLTIEEVKSFFESWGSSKRGPESRVLLSDDDDSK